ncbi:hypothetical protein ACFSKW_34405 [Nonomuraea mangrovi]|uniref:Amidohydrolase n=1 Tax=Nonomuraea mangrovi TaxID=2316207 RepID=A0ABW4T5E1_9ACTN
MLRHFDHAVEAEIEARYGLHGLPQMRTAFDPALIGPATEEEGAESVAAALGGDDRARWAVAEFIAVPFAVDEDVRALLENVETAGALGMTGVRYRTVADPAAVLT